MIMSLTCLKQTDTHTHRHIQTHTRLTHIHTSILLNDLSSLALNILYFVTSLDDPGLNRPTSLLVLLRLLTGNPSCGNVFIFVIAGPVLNPVSGSQLSKCTQPFTASELLLLQFSVWKAFSHLSLDTIITPTFPEPFQLLFHDSTYFL